MSVDPALLIRRWPERRPVVLTGAVLGFAVVAAIAGLSDAPTLAALYVVPVLLVALELGPVGGIVAAAIAAAFAIGSGAVVPAMAAVVAGGIAGRFSGRMRAVHEGEQRLLDSAIALGRLATHEQLSQAVADAALRTPGATGVEVALGGRRAKAGETQGRHTAVDIGVRGERLGSIELSHSRRLEPEDYAALQLLAVQAGLAADNRRLLDQEREAAAIRAGLGQLLDAEEDDRRRHADTLHEELAQVLAGVLMQLRAGYGDDGSLAQLQDDVRGVLAELRDVATELRPSALGQLGLVPALEAIDGVTMEADGVLDPVPEPLRTGVFRLVEHVVAGTTTGATVQVQFHDDELAVTIDAVLTDSEVVAAAGARVALLGGTLSPEAMPDGRTRLQVRLPMRHALQT